MILLIEKDGQTLPVCGQIQNLCPVREISMGAGDKDNSFIINVSQLSLEGPLKSW